MRAKEIVIPRLDEINFGVDKDYYYLLDLLRNIFPAWIKWRDIQNLAKFRVLNESDMDELEKDEIVKVVWSPKKDEKTRKIIDGIPYYTSFEDEKTYRLSTKGFQLLASFDSMNTNRLLRNLTTLLVLLGIGALINSLFPILITMFK